MAKDFGQVGGTGCVMLGLVGSCYEVVVVLQVQHQRAGDWGRADSRRLCAWQQRPTSTSMCCVVGVFVATPLQERLWRRRAAYHIGHAAAAEGRRRLEKAAAAKEAAAKSSSGRGSKAQKKEEAEQQLKEQQSIAGGLQNRGEGRWTASAYAAIAVAPFDYDVTD